MTWTLHAPMSLHMLRYINFGELKTLYILYLYTGISLLSYRPRVLYLGGGRGGEHFTNFSVRYIQSSTLYSDLSKCG